MKTFKKVLGISALVVVIGLLAFGAINRTMAQNETVENDLLGDITVDENRGSGTSGSGFISGGNGNGTGSSTDGSVVSLDHESSVTPLALLPAGEVNQAEIDALLFMREEEKLARDVYTFLAANWNLPVFSNIASSEQTHMDSVLELINRYEISDSASVEAGVFNNAELQTLYTQLVAQGSLSLEDAFKVGAAIEEIDILDLQKRLAQTDQLDIQQVFENLLNGSYNHLNAFVGNLSSRTGVAYEPQYLSSEAYQTILADSANSGGASGYGQGANGTGKGNH